MPTTDETVDEEKLPPLQQWLLLQIRKYGPFTAAKLREELETMRNGGADMRGLNVDEVHLALVQLEKHKLIKLGSQGWERNAEAVVESKPKQTKLF